MPDPSPRIDAQTRLITLLGHPVEHSFSPALHNAALQEQGVNAVYVATPVRPEGLADAVAGLRALRFLGANVTIPHKETVAAHLDAVSDRAAAVGAVNTIVAEDPGGASEDASAAVRLRGDNTDVAGFLEPLQAQVPEDNLRGADMLIFGAGGAARAVVYALLTTYAPDRLTLVARRPEQADAVAQAMQEHDSRDALAVQPFEAAGPAVRASRLLVNATPLGMHPNPDDTPWPDADDFRAEQIAYDLVYNPGTTRFLRAAADRGATPIGGQAMLVAQAAASYRQWTGRAMPTDAARAALDAALAAAA